MDLNHRLIEAVRQCPLLYKNNVTLSDRKCGWQQIAEQMKMREALLKTRWHFLREHYKRTTLTESQLNSSHFPYKKEMEFLLPYLRPSPKGEQRNEGEPLPVNIIKPEFVITEKDLENDSGNEEYVFLEVEALGSEYETTNEDAQQISESELRKELQEELRKELQEDQQEEGQQQHEEDESEDLGHLELEVHIKQEKLDEMPTHNDNPKIIFVKENSHEKMEATCNRNGSKEDESVRCQIQDAVEEKKDNRVEVREGDSSSDNLGADCVKNENNASRNSTSEERCEDAIFGELVSAMLKKMPAEKKRNIKRDIMNLLLT